MTSREPSMDDPSRPLMSTAEPAGPPPPGRTTTHVYTPPAGRYRDEEDEDDDREKQWPLNMVLLHVVRVLLAVLALVAAIRMIRKRGRDQSEDVEVVLVVVGFVQLLWNLVKVTPRRPWAALLLLRAGGRRSAACTLGAFRLVLLAREDGDDDDERPPATKPPSRLLAMLKKSLVDLLVMLVLLICTLVYATEYHNWNTRFFVPSMMGLYFTAVALQALCVVLPHMNTCGPFSVTVNRARRDYRYRIQLPQDEVRTAGSGKQHVSVSAV